ncbi:unnamed protein product [Mytilus coruscus]|uniref:Uncharacterized protein n=1 Tax=Mytilus coruscus TaxID=42192 RepID=A0A6J8B383_MYTCO|nr:unnamed protein product [Mytilus coruscus]
MLNDVTTDLKDLLNTAEQIVEDRAKNKENIGKAKATTLQTIQENDFQNFVPSYECIDVNFKASELKSTYNSLGSVEIKSVPCSIAHKPFKHTQAQIPPEYEKMPTKFNLKNEFKVPYSNGKITSMVVTNDNRLLLCYSGDKSKAMSIWSETGYHIQDCKLAAPAWGIAIIPGTNEAVVTLPFINSIQFVNITSMVPDNLYVTTLNTDKLHRMSKDGKFLDILLKKKDGLDQPFGIAFNKNYTKLYIANGRKANIDAIRVDISKQESDFQNLIPSYECINVNFKASKIKSALNSLGSMEITSVPCSITYNPSKHAQAQIPAEYEKMPTKFKLNNHVKLPYPNVGTASIVVTNDNRLLLCYSEDKSKSLSVWSETGDHIQNCVLAGTAWGIAIIPGTNEVVVTLPSIKSIQFVNITSLVPGKAMKVPDKCYGVTVIKEMIVLGGIGKVYFLSMTGSLIKSFHIGSDYLNSLKANKMDMIFCCETGNDTLHCIDIKGTVIFSYKSPSFNGPIGMAFDGKENLYVATWKPNILHRLLKDGKLIDILLKKEDGLNEPYAVAFNKNYIKLYIANGLGTVNKDVLIFDCA